MSTSGKPFPSNIVKGCSFTIIVLGIVAILFLFLFECSGQTPPPAPRYNEAPPVEQPQFYWLPAQGPLLTPGNFLRRVWGVPPVLSPYVAYGPPYQVQPVAPYYQSPYRRAW
jgi:hypothetical protein